MCGAYETKLPLEVLLALQEGDLIFVGNFRSWMSWLIMYFTNSQVSHVAMYVGDGKILHATLHGGELAPIEAVFEDGVRLLACKVPIADESRQRARAWLADSKDDPLYFERPYSFKRVLLEALWIVSGRDVPFFRWRLFVDIALMFVLGDVCTWAVLGRPAGGYLVMLAYLAIICVNRLRWPPRRSSWFTRTRGTPIDLLSQALGWGGGFMPDPMSPWSQRAVRNPLSPWAAQIFRRRANL
jgi:NlpC/P60 family